MRPDIAIVQFRGNVETRLRKLEQGVAQATLLAAAGLNRLGLAAEIASIVPVDEMLPAVAQGAIGIETREDATRIRELLSAIDDETAAIAVRCERAFLAALDGSCRTPLAGHATVEGNRVSFRGQALTLDGAHSFEAGRQGSVGDAANMGRDAGEEVKARGGALIAY
jgi:hydroxymethylbilane synthase